MNKIKVLIVDDSALVRLTMKKLLDSDSRIEVIGTANDPYQAVKEMKKKAPDVITLDIQMPKMDGITFLKKIIQQHPLPVVICSALTEKGSSLGIEALNLGAVEIITKPKVGTKQFFEESKISICDSIVAASRVSVAHLRAKGQMNQSSRTKSSTNLLPKVKLNSTKKIIAIGASTGGTDAIRTVLRNIPKESPGIVIVQHMPEFFTASFAKSVNKICKIEVKEANQGDAILPGTALIAPGNKHMKIKKVGQRYSVQLETTELVNRHRPAVDVLFDSVAEFAKKDAVGCILTGMGNDGAKGMKKMFDAGAYTIAQDEKSCVVFGMPKEAIEIGAVNQILPLVDIAINLMNRVTKQ